MLRAKDGSLARDWRLLTQGSAVGLVAAVTLLATAIRGLAEPPETESDEELKLMAINGLMQSDPERAIPLLSRALSGNRKSAELHTALGAALIAADRPAEAASSFRRARGRRSTPSARRHGDG